MATSTTMEEVFEESRAVIAMAVAEQFGASPIEAVRFAGALIARLTRHEPPILLAYPDELKD